MGSSIDKMVDSLHVGSQEIVRFLTKLPKTKHDVTGASEIFCVDAWPVGQGDNISLFITIHGQFIEGDVIFHLHCGVHY